MALQTKLGAWRSFPPPNLFHAISPPPLPHFPFYVFPYHSHTSERREEKPREKRGRSREEEEEERREEGESREEGEERREEEKGKRKLLWE